MNMTICEVCKLPLEVTPEMMGQAMACPRCRAPVPTSRGSNKALDAPPVAGVTADPRAAPFDVRSRPFRRPFHNSATSLFDLSFTRYVTPLIVKIQWVLALTLAAVWLLAIVLGLVASVLPEVPEAPAQAAKRSRNWEFRPPAAIERAGDASYEVALNAALVITQIVAIILILLWVRMALEGIIVVFHMATSLKSIDDKTPASR